MSGVVVHPRAAGLAAAPVQPGRCDPLGATVYPGGVNFSVFSRSATLVELLLFDDRDDARPSRVVALDPARHRTYQYWHAFVPGAGEGQLYGYRAFGPRAPHAGDQFDGSKLLIDPYARVVAPARAYDRRAAIRPGDNAGHAMKSVVVDRRGYDWEGDVSPGRPYAQSVIYELHVRGFTRHPSSGVAPARRGTYAGLVDKIPYLTSLGITAVELMPVQQFDPQEGPGGVNYWGYGPIALFAPHAGYSSRKDPLGPVAEFRDMVKALHRAGIEVILDVVFNHTGEGGAGGPILSWRGFENRDYYLVDPADPGRYVDFSGCGNTLNSNRSVVRRMVLDCLRHWVSEMHVDGFRFDLASVLSRDDEGKPMGNPPLLWDIESDPTLAGCKIIAEAWDAGGLYQVGSFVGHRWAEWNGRYRDDVRRFLRGDRDTAGAFAQRLAGSRDIYGHPDRDPNRSINFVTCHDGFTLADLVSYEHKHNQANGEDNRDGTDANWSWNGGVEGETDDPGVLALRRRQVRNALTVLFCSAGTPMLLMGDEAGRTQQGNNNPHNQDSPVSWMDWSQVDRNADLVRFVRELIHTSRGLSFLELERFWANLDPPVVTWHGVRLGEPDLAPWSHSLAMEVAWGGERLYLAVNAYREPLEFELPTLPGGRCWRRWIDTSQPPPADIVPAGEAPAVDGATYCVGDHAVVALLAEPVAGVPPAAGR